MPFPAPLTLRIFSFGSLKVHRRKTRSLSEAARIQPLRFPHFSSPPFPPRPLRAASEHRVPHARTGAALTHRRPHAPPPPPPALQFCSLISTFPSIFFLARQRSAVTRLERAACGKERRRRASALPPNAGRRTGGGDRTKLSRVLRKVNHAAAIADGKHGCGGCRKPAALRTAPGARRKVPAGAGGGPLRHAAPARPPQSPQPPRDPRSRADSAEAAAPGPPRPCPAVPRSSPWVCRATFGTCSSSPRPLPRRRRSERAARRLRPQGLPAARPQSGLLGERSEPCRSPGGSAGRRVSAPPKRRLRAAASTHGPAAGTGSTDCSAPQRPPPKHCAAARPTTAPPRRSAHAQGQVHALTRHRPLAARPIGRRLGAASGGLAPPTWPLICVTRGGGEGLHLPACHATQPEARCRPRRRSGCRDL